MELKDANIMLLTACLIPEIKMDNCAWDKGWSAGRHTMTWSQLDMLERPCLCGLQSHWEDI